MQRTFLGDEAIRFFLAVANVLRGCSADYSGQTTSKFVSGDSVKQFLGRLLPQRQVLQVIAQEPAPHFRAGGSAIRQRHVSCSARRLAPLWAMATSRSWRLCSAPAFRRASILSADVPMRRHELVRCETAAPAKSELGAN